MNIKLLSLVFLVLVVGLSEKIEAQEPDLYKNMYTHELLSKTEYTNLVGSLLMDYPDSIRHDLHLGIKFQSLIDSNGFKIRPFKYEIRIGTEYTVRALKYEKIGMELNTRNFLTIDGDSVAIGGKQTKPTLINLWFIGCRGCVAEIPALNLLRDKYSDRVNFIAITYDDDLDVKEFVKKKEFNFQQVASSNFNGSGTSIKDYIKKIGSYPYPENIFVDRNGIIRYIEGGLSHGEDLEKIIKHFELILEELLSPTKI